MEQLADLSLQRMSNPEPQEVQANPSTPIYPPENMLTPQEPISKVQAITKNARSQNSQRVRQQQVQQHTEFQQNQHIDVDRKQSSRQLQHSEASSHVASKTSHHTSSPKQQTTNNSQAQLQVTEQSDGAGSNNSGSDGGDQQEKGQQRKAQQQEQRFHNQTRLHQGKQSTVAKLQHSEQLKARQSQLTRQLEKAQGVRPSQGKSQDFLHRVSTSIPQMLQRIYRDEKIENLPESETVNALYMVLRLGGAFTHDHSDRVMNLSLKLADEMGVTKAQTRKQIKYGALLKDIGESGFQFAKENNPQKQEAIATFFTQSNVIRMGRLHDIGKIQIPHHILHKPGKLTEEEFAIIKMHPVYGERILYPIKSLRYLCPAVRGHHERYDGHGYPDKLAGEKIPLPARIIAVADVYDALVSSRPYKSGMPIQKAVDILREDRGKAFDPACVDAFLRIIKRDHPDIQ